MKRYYSARTTRKTLFKVQHGVKTNMADSKTLAKFLEASRGVTENYIKACGIWSEKDQWKKIREEEKEFKHPKNNLNELEEFWDCFFAKLTLLHIKGIDDYAILESANSTLMKITSRSIDALMKSSKHGIPLQ